MASYDDFLHALAMQESSNRPWVENQRGYVGLYQLGESALQDAGYYFTDPSATYRNSWTGIWTGNDGVYSLDDFLSNPQAQTDALNAYFAKNVGYIHSYGLQRYLGTQIAGIPVTESGMLAAAHLGGIGSLRSFLNSGGMINNSDSTKTVADYMQQFAGYDTPFDFSSPPDPSEYSHFLTSSFDISDPFSNIGNLSDQFSQALMPAGWDQLPDITF